MLVDLLRRQEVHGLNVTIPYKQEITSYLDGMTPSARAIGAVNTLIGSDGRVIGDNTDAPGFLADLIRLCPELVDHPSTVLILGAGGAARAVVYALLQAGWQVTIAARRLEQGEELVRGLSSNLGTTPPSAIFLSTTAVSEWLASKSKSSTGVDLVVNTTPVGMSPHTNVSPWPEGVAIPGGAFVYDLVYNPAETLLVRQARQASMGAASGLGMLVEQAALAFERWTKRHPDRQVMYQAVSTFYG
jgi:shikimate dehydrogenase